MFYILLNIKVSFHSHTTPFTTINTQQLFTMRPQKWHKMISDLINYSLEMWSLSLKSTEIRNN